MTEFTIFGSAATFRTVEQWKAQPLYVIQDASFDSIISKLKNGSRCEWTYMGKCDDGCEKNRHLGKCSCPKMMNVLAKDPNSPSSVIRVVDGIIKPVFPMSTFMAFNNVCASWGTGGVRVGNTT